MTRRAYSNARWTECIVLAIGASALFGPAPLPAQGARSGDCSRCGAPADPYAAQRAAAAQRTVELLRQQQLAKQQEINAVYQRIAADRQRQQNAAAARQQRIQQQTQAISQGIQLFGSIFQQYAEKRRREEEQRAAARETQLAQEELRRTERAEEEARIAVDRAEGTMKESTEAELRRAEEERLAAERAKAEAEEREKRRLEDGVAARDASTEALLAEMTANVGDRSIFDPDPEILDPPISAGGAELREAISLARDAWDRVSFDPNTLINQVGDATDRLRHAIWNGMSGATSSLVNNDLAARPFADYVDAALSTSDAMDELVELSDNGGLLGGLVQHMKNGVTEWVGERLEHAYGSLACGIASEGSNGFAVAEANVWRHACTAPLLLIDDGRPMPRRLYDWHGKLVDRFGQLIDATGLNGTGQ